MADYDSDLLELIRKFKESRFTLLEVSSGVQRVLLRRAAPQDAPLPSARPEAPQPAPSQVPVPGPASAPPSTQEPMDPAGALTSPRVGRFYQLQDAQGQSVLKAGTRLTTGQVYGIIESMHLRYEIRSDRDGIVERVLVPSGEPVEYGQPLLLLQS